MKRLLGALLTVTMACAPLVSKLPHLPDGSLDYATMLRWSEQGLAPACRPDAETLPANVCKFAFDSIDIAIAKIEKNPASGAAATRQLVMDLVTAFPVLKGWLDWMFPPS